MASATEGVIRFSYRLDDVPPPGTSGALFDRLNAWRSILHRLSLVGQCPTRYGGHGYGNLSLRAQPGAFLITASQTGGKAVALPEDWTLVRNVNLRDFRVDATGHKPPSSEAMTHAMIYTADPAITCVLHVHCPEIWRLATRLGLPQTRSEFGYGTPELAGEMQRLLATNPARPLVFTTPGHEDGVFACGPDVEATARTLLGALASALAAS